MSDYVICTDTACDIKAPMLEEWGVRYVGMTFTFDGEQTEYSNNDMDILEFYNKMRAGGVARTAAVNPEGFTAVFEQVLKEGKDVLYLGLSAPLSTTFNAAMIAADDLRQVYPERKIITVDTRSAPAGEGFLVHLAVEKKKEGASIEETAAYIEGLKLKICHWFVVDDLVYLKRGGRVSPAAAFAGALLGIKPILHVNREGNPINIAKVRGKKAALSWILEKYGTLAEDPHGGTVYVSHADSIEDVEKLKAELKAAYGVDIQLTTDIGPVLGAHTGPGALALFFVGKDR